MDSHKKRSVCIAAIGMAMLILEGKIALDGAYDGIQLCLKTVIPSLFPFLILSLLLNSALYGISSPFLGWIGKAFRVPRSCSAILIPAFLGGYPVGAQSVCTLYEEKLISKRTAERMLCFCNQAGPAFLFGMVGTAFSQRYTVWILWIIQLAGALFSAQILNITDSSQPMKQRTVMSLSEALKNAISILSQICGWIVLFRILLAFCRYWFLSELPVWAQVLFSGLLELSNGCCMLSQIPEESTRFLIASILLSLGGFCIWMQTASVTNGLDMGYFLLGKMLQTGFVITAAVAYSAHFWGFLPFSMGLFLFCSQYFKKRSSNPAIAGV